MFKLVEKLQVGKSSKSNTSKSLVVCDIIIKTEGLGYVFRKTGKTSANSDKKLSGKLMRNPRRTLQIGAKLGIAVVPRNLEEAFSTILYYDRSQTFHYTGKDFYLVTFVLNGKKLSVHFKIRLLQTSSLCAIENRFYCE